jgi:formate dehydrogenase major subunit
MSGNGMIELEINGKKVEAKTGQTIYEVVTEQGIDDIPVLCHSPELKPYASCFVCVVELEGKPNLVPSCATKVAPGMKVITRNERIEASRKTALELLMSNHYADCIAPCVIGCPAHVDVQGYIALAARGQYAEAADLIRQTNPLPAVCGRVCVRKCEGVCRRQLVDDPVAINDLKRYITDSPDAYEGWPERKAATGKRVAIVGAGPAGLSAAYYLGLKGHTCTILEMMEEPGGMLRYGIPSYRLPRNVLAKEVEYITSRAGVEIRCNEKLGRDYNLAGLREGYDAVFLAMGAMGANAMQVPGEENTPGVLKGLDFLIEMAQAPQPVHGTVVVIGGGNTAMDAARTSWRLGADKVLVIYRRTRAEMPADPMEVEALREEGIDVIELGAPQELVVNAEGKLTGIKCIRMKLGEPDASGRRRPVPVEGSEFVQNCDYCISAIGQTPVLDGIADDDPASPASSKWNTIVSDKDSYATRVPGVFAGGDVQSGASVAIDCIAAGQRAARSIHTFLMNEPVDLGQWAHMAHFNTHTAPHCDFKQAIVMSKDLLAEVQEGDLGESVKLARQKLPEIEVEERNSSFEEVSLGFGWDEAHHEWRRCLECGCTEVNDCRLREYCSEYGVELTKYSGKVRKHRVDERHPYITIDNNKCILCTRCIRTCEQVLGLSAIGLVNRGFGAMIQPAMGKPLAETPCVSCGNCEAACPTGAITIRLPFPGKAVVPSSEERSTCGFCSLGCQIRVRKTDDKHFWIDEPREPGYNRLCRWGRFGPELYLDQERVVSPLKREGGHFRETSFEDAYADIVADMQHAVQRYGPEAVAVFTGPELTNEQMFLAQRIAREALKTNNIACLSTLLVESAPNPLTPVLGFTQTTCDRRELENADVIILNNCDLELEQLILSMKVIEAIQRGAKVIAASGVRTELHRQAYLNLDPMRGTSATMWRAVSKLVLEHGNSGAVASFPGGEKYISDLAELELDTMLHTCGEDQDHLADAAQQLRDAKNVVIIHSPDRSDDKSPGDIIALGNLMALLHTQGVKTNLMMPRSASNTTGLESCGCAVEFMPGRLPVPDELLKVTPRRDTLLQRLVNGEIKAALILGEDPLRNNKVHAYLENVKFLAVMTDTMSETANAADIVLPGTNYLEEPGTRVNFEGRIMQFKPALVPPAGRSGWSVLSGLAGAFRLMGVNHSVENSFKQLTEAVRAGYGEHTPFYWNTGQPRIFKGPKSFQPFALSSEAHTIQHYLTAMQRYKYDASVIGVKYFRTSHEEALKSAGR